MMKKLVVLTVLSLFSSIAVGQDMSTLLQRIPDSANVLAMINTKALMNTPRANAEGWASKRHLDYLSGRMPFPPASNFTLAAGEFTPSEGRYAWQVALVEFPGDVYEDKIAKNEGSDVELVENLYVIPSRRNMYLVQFDRQHYASFSPANRQKMMKWVSFAKNNTVNKVSPYLTDAITTGNGQGLVTVALDLSNTLDRVELTKRLQSSKVMSGNKVDIKQWSDFLYNIRGIRLVINVTSVLQTELHLDFKDNVDPFAKILPALFVETMDNLGFHLTDVSQWESKARNKTLTMRGTLENDDVKRILNLVLPPTMGPSTQDSNLSGQALVATTSQQYFQAVDNLLKDMRSRADQYDRLHAWTTSAAWYEYTANKIEQLPVVNTDDTLLQYSAQVIAQLRLCGQSCRGVDIERQVLTTELRTSKSGGWGGLYYNGGSGWSTPGMSSNEDDVKTAKAKNAANGMKKRNDIWISIGEQTTALRIELSKKYGLEF